MEMDYYIAKTEDGQYGIFSWSTNDRVLDRYYDLILPIIGNRYAIVGNKTCHRFKEYDRDVTEFSFSYSAFDLLNNKELWPLKEDEYSLLYIDLENHTVYYSLESDSERTIREMGFNGRPKLHSGPIKYTFRQYNYRYPNDPKNMESPDFVSPESDIDNTGVFPHSDSKWDFIYSYLHEDKSCVLAHRFCFSFGDVNVPNAHIRIVNNLFCIISQTVLKELSAIYNADAIYGDRVYGEDDDQGEVFQKNVAIFNEYRICLLFSQNGFNYELASDDRLMLYGSSFKSLYHPVFLSSSGSFFYFPKDVVFHNDGQYSFKSSHFYKVVSNRCFGYTNLDAKIVIPCIFPIPKYKYYFYRDAARNNASTFYDALEGDASNYWNID